MDNKYLTASRLVLGTAQLGMDYGIANKSGKPGRATALAIVEAAYTAGVREFDTAQAYGESERVLGVVFRELGIKGEVKVTSKLSPRIVPLNASSVLNCVKQSLDRLGIGRLEHFLLHREDMLDSLDEGLGEALRSLVEGGYIQSPGVSVYSPERARQALRSDIINVVHLPSNVLDRRFSNAGIFDLADRLGKRIYVRSIFLQGLILMDDDNVPSGLGEVRPVLKELDRLAGRYGTTRQAIALIYLREKFGNAMIIFGAEEPWQVRQNVYNWEQEAPSGFIEEIDSAVLELDSFILDPSRWFHSRLGG